MHPNLEPPMTPRYAPRMRWRHHMSAIVFYGMLALLAVFIITSWLIVLGEGFGGGSLG
jgi:hypothetical protein